MSEQNKDGFSVSEETIEYLTDEEIKILKSDENPCTPIDFPPMDKEYWNQILFMELKKDLRRLKKTMAWYGIFTSLAFLFLLSEIGHIQKWI